MNLSTALRKILLFYESKRNVWLIIQLRFPGSLLNFLKNPNLGENLWKTIFNVDIESHARFNRNYLVIKPFKLYHSYNVVLSSFLLISFTIPPLSYNIKEY